MGEMVRLAAIAVDAVVVVVVAVAEAVAAIMKREGKTANPHLNGRRSYDPSPRRGRESSYSRPIYPYDDGSTNKNDGTNMSMKVGGMIGSFIGNLSGEVNEDDLHKLFDKFGKIAELKVMRDKEQKSRFDRMHWLTERGYGFVTFESPEDATEALKEK